jgi:hypothetical protein
MIRSLTAILALALMATPALGSTQFSEVAAARNLNYTTSYGTTFPELNLGASMMQRNMGNGAAVGDYDRDGDLDIYVVGQLGQLNRLFRSDLDSGSKSFTEVSAAAGVDSDGFSRMATFVDLDNDGWLDLVVLNDDNGLGVSPPSYVYRNRGDGTFEDMSLNSGLARTGLIRGGMSFADYDADGLLDIYISNWCRETGSGSPQLPGSNLLLKNVGGFQFQDVSFDTHLNYVQRDSFTAIFHDFDGDSRPDIYVAIDHTSDLFYRNLDIGLFVDDTTGTNLVHTGNDMGATAADFDDDGDLDIYATNITDPDYLFGSTQYNALHVNQMNSSGTLEFIDEAASRNVEDTFWGWGVQFSDIENDGDLDLIAATGFDEFVYFAGLPDSPLLDSPMVLFENNGSGSFSNNTSSGLGGGDDSRALIAFDYDRDGDQDLLMTNIQEPVRLFENVGTQAGNWLSVSLVQSPGMNRDGIGATVFYTIGSKTRRRDIIVNDSYLSGKPAELHLGLGSATSVDELRVVWTDGNESFYNSISANQTLRLSYAANDSDLDGVGDATDCLPSNGEAWIEPDAVAALQLKKNGSDTELTWELPASSGGMNLVYDVLRGSDPRTGDASCWLTGITDRTAADTNAPSPLLYYLVRSRNDCGGSLGAASTTRPSPTCP